MVIGANALRAVICVLMIRRPRQPAAVPRGVRGAGAGQELPRGQVGHRAHGRAVRRRAGRGQLAPVVPVGRGRRSRPRSPAAWPFLVAGSQGVLVLAVIVFAVAAVLGVKVPATQVAADRTSETEREELRGGGIVLAASAMGVLRGIVGFLTFLIAFSLRSSDAPTWQFGLVLAASGIGSLLGSLVAPRPAAQRHGRGAHPADRAGRHRGGRPAGRLGRRHRGRGRAGAVRRAGGEQRQAGVRLGGPARRPRRQPRAVVRPVRDPVPAHVGGRGVPPGRDHHPDGGRLPRDRGGGRLRGDLLPGGPAGPGPGPAAGPPAARPRSSRRACAGAGWASPGTRPTASRPGRRRPRRRGRTATSPRPRPRSSRRPIRTLPACSTSRPRGTPRPPARRHPPRPRTTTSPRPT